MKSTLLHIGIIMDGNGRWALARGLPRIAGHHAGAQAVRRTVEAASDFAVGTLTLFAFSSDNWKRSGEEVSTLMQLFEEHLNQESERCANNGIRLEVIGRRDRLPLSLVAAIAEAECRTAGLERLRLRIAVDYSARDAIRRNEIGPDLDLLIRTGGEQRLSDFLLWESAYAELVFSRCMWPDFDVSDLEAAVREFHSRQRRFGAVPAVRASRESWLD